MANDGFNDNVNLNGYDADSDNLVMNLNDVDENKGGFEALPPGVYDALIENTEYGISANGGNPMITWQFRITDGEYANRMQFTHTVLNKELGVATLKKIIIRCVPEVDMGSFNPKKFCDEGTALGFACRLKLKIDLYKGEKRNRVVEVLAPASTEGFLDA